MKAIELPEWYANQTDQDTSLDIPHPKRKTTLAVRKALASIGEVLTSELSGSEVNHSWLSRVEPRVRIFGIVVLVFATTLLHRLLPLAGLFLMLVALAASIRLPARRIARVWLGVPLFSLAIILPAVLNIVTDGPAVFTVWHCGAGARLGPWRLPETISVTQTGLVVAARFLLRSLDCITLSFLLISSTDSATLVSSLRRLGMPKAFGMVLAMMQRYLVVLLRTVEEIHLAKLSRTISAGSVRHEQRWVAAGIGVLFRHTYRLAEEVRLAMVSRGYDGDLQVSQVSRWQLSDVAWIVGVAVFTTGVLLADRLL